jgi:hypothetical protein
LLVWHAAGIQTRRHKAKARSQHIPKYATTIVTTNEIIDLMSSAHASELGGH